jgi:hypothetical protein
MLQTFLFLGELYSQIYWEKFGRNDAAKSLVSWGIILTNILGKI